jgi:sugar/nucleoside kinase (ribokinase family)
MFHMVSLEPVDYLVVGHLTVDLTAQGPALGGTAAYAALTARAFGLRVGVVSAWGGEIPLAPLEGIQVLAVPAGQSTTFENTYSNGERIQHLRRLAPPIDYAAIPEAWWRAPILHLGPVAGELDPNLPATLRPGLLGLTPQGWMRAWDENGRVRPTAWQGAEGLLQRAGAVVFSVEDVAHNEESIESLAHQARLLAVTEGLAGCRLFWHGDSRRFRAPQVQEIDATGAGDIFAAAFFVRLQATRDPWEAARFAVNLAALSVQRPGLAGIPTPSEIQTCLMEVLH